jgi:hypothetical protein
MADEEDNTAIIVFWVFFGIFIFIGFVMLLWYAFRGKKVYVMKDYNYPVNNKSYGYDYTSWLERRREIQDEIAIAKAKNIEEEERLTKIANLENAKNAFNQNQKEITLQDKPSNLKSGPVFQRKIFPIRSTNYQSVNFETSPHYGMSEIEEHKNYHKHTLSSANKSQKRGTYAVSGNKQSTVKKTQ